MFSSSEISSRPFWTLVLSVIVSAGLGSSFSAEAQPANDNCVTAQPVIIPASGTVCINSSSVGATSSLTTNTCNTVTVNEVWFSYIAAGPSNTITVTPNGGNPLQQPVVTISDAACGSGTYNSCDAAATAGGAATANWAYAAGTQVNVSVAGITGDGTFEICITSETPPPTPGSNCAGATSTCDPSNFTLASSAGNLSSGIAPSCFNILGAPQIVQNDMWFVFTVGQTGTLEFTANLNGVAEYDWAVFDITNGCPGSEVACNYWFSNGNSGSLGLGNPAGGEFIAPITVFAGNTYAIMLDNYDNNGVGFDFSWGGTFEMAPTADFVADNPTGCNLLTTTFTNNTVGASTYTWNFGNGATSTLQNPPAQTYTTPGTYFVTLDATSAAGCTNSFSASVEVFEEPTVTFTVTDETCVSACDGELTANASGNGPFTYAWTGLSGNSATQPNLCANTYDVTVTDQNTSCSGSGTGTVQSGGTLANATIDPAGPFCVGETPVNLTAASAGGTWSGTGITNPATGTFDPALAGVGSWTVTYTIAGACGNSDTETIVVDQNADATITPVGPFCSSEPSVNLTAVTSGGTWSGTGITDAALGTFDPSVAGVGTWTITYSIPGACGDAETTDIEINEITFSQTVTDALCYGDASGSVQFQNPTGTAPHLYSVDDGQNFQNTDLIQNLLAGNYDLVVEDANGCAAIAVPVTINEPTEIFPSAFMDQQANCGNADGVATASGVGGTVATDYQYSWNTTPVQTTSTVTNLPPGLHSVTLTDDNGCSASTDVNITSTPGFTISISSTTDATCNDFCNGDATALEDNTAVQPVSFLWNDPSAQTTATASGLCAGTYSVTATDAAGCTATASATVNEPSPFTVSVNPTLSTVCIGEPTTLTTTLNGGAAPVTNFQWTAAPLDPTLAATDQSPTVEPVVETTYSLTATDASGCLAPPVDVTIAVSSPLSLDILLPTTGDTGICEGSSAIINLSASGGNGVYSYYLEPDLTNPISNTQVVQPISTTTYDFVVTDGCGTPPATVSSTVTVYPAPNVDFGTDVPNGCLPHLVTFEDLTSPAPSSWEWDFGDPDSNGNTSQSQNPSHMYTETGSYSVSLSVTTAEGCTGQSTQNGLINIYQPPLADFETDTHQNSIIDPKFEFTDLSTSDVVTWDWDFGDGNTSSDQHPTNTYLDTGLFVVNLTVINSDGCEASATGRVYLSPIRTLYVPNSFTPNDDRFNNTFRAYGEGYDWSTFQMMVYNRWGEEIFRSNVLEVGWDGKYKSNDVEEGMYAWRIYIDDFYGRTYPFNGHVMLLR